MGNKAEMIFSHKNKKIALLLFMTVFLMFGSAVKNLQANSNKQMFVWVSNLRLRSAPNLKSRTVGFVKEGAKVEILGPKSSNSITVTLRGKKLTSPFYKIRTRKGKVGWAFGGALSNKPVLSASYKRRVISKIDKSVKVVKKLVVSISKFQEYSIGDSLIAGFGTAKKGVLLKHIKGGYTPPGNPIAKYYFQYGIFVNYIKDEYRCYYVNNFPKLKNGLRPGLSKSQVKKILGSNPLFMQANLLYYYYEGDMSSGTNQRVILFFRNGKLFAIKVSYGLGC